MSSENGVDPEHEALLADSVGLALLVVLETLAPAERLAFVLHDMFGVPFEEIAADRGPLAGGGATARQPRSPAGAGLQRPCPTPTCTAAQVVDAFLAAARARRLRGAARGARSRRRAPGRSGRRGGGRVGGRSRGAGAHVPSPSRR